MNFALVLAAGSGTRMNNEQPKQFLMVNNKPLFYYSVESFNRNKDIDAIVIVTNNEYIEQVQNWCIEYNLCKVKSVVKGGQTRQESVYNGLQELSKIVDNLKDLVLIHDSARPLVTQRIINENISMPFRIMQSSKHDHKSAIDVDYGLAFHPACHLRKPDSPCADCVERKIRCAGSGKVERRRHASRRNEGKGRSRQGVAYPAVARVGHRQCVTFAHIAVWTVLHRIHHVWGGTSNDKPPSKVAINIPPNANTEFSMYGVL